MALLAEHAFEEIGLAEVAGRAGLKLSQLRAEFGSTLAIVAAHIKDIDRIVLAGGDADMAEETGARAAVRRADAPARSAGAVQGRRCARCCARRGAIRASRWRSTPWRCARRHWMLEAAGIGAHGPRGALRAQGAALMFARVLAVWSTTTSGPRPHHGRARPRRWPAPSAGPASSTICAASPPRSAAARAAGAGARSMKAPRKRKPTAAVSVTTPAPSPSRASRRAGLSPSMMSPPCERAMSRAIARPRPVPPSS